MIRIFKQNNRFFCYFLAIFFLSIFYPLLFSHFLPNLTADLLYKSNGFIVLLPVLSHKMPFPFH